MPISHRVKVRGHSFKPGNKHLKKRSVFREQPEEDSLPEEDSTVSQNRHDDVDPVDETPAEVQPVTQGSGEAAPTHAYNLRSMVSGQEGSGTQQEENQVRNRLVDMNRVVHLFNNAIQAHSKQSKDHMPHFAWGSETKWGLGCKISLVCNLCTFQTEEKKMYAEVDTGRPGRKAAESNIGLAVATQNTAIGPTKVQTLIGAGLNMPVPSRKAMQRNAAQASEAVTQLNEADMEKHVREVRDEEGIIQNISIDARYNSAHRANRRKFGQAASQAIAAAIETDSKDKKIVSIHIQNKLCPTGSRLKAQGKNVQCPGDDHKCTANLPEFEPLSEFVMGEAIGRKLAATGTRVKYVTSDGDARAAKGVTAGQQTEFADWDPERLADPTHLQGTMKNYMFKNVTFTDSMFPDCHTKAARTDAKKHLINDMTVRSTQICMRTAKACADDTAAFCEMLPRCMEIALQCYQGDHSGCVKLGKDSTCRGTEEDHWVLKSTSLGPFGIKRLNPTESDIAQMKTAYNITLGPEAAVKLRFGTNTQKNEAFNRAISARAPKTVNFSTTLPGRVHMAALAVNHGEGQALKMALETSGVTPSPDASRFLDRKQKDSEYQKKYAVSDKRKRQLSKSKARKQQDYINRSKKGKMCGDYEKHQLDLAGTSNA